MSFGDYKSLPAASSPPNDWSNDDESSDPDAKNMRTTPIPMPPAPYEKSELPQTSFNDSYPRFSYIISWLCWTGGRWFLYRVKLNLPLTLQSPFLMRSRSIRIMPTSPHDNPIHMMIGSAFSFSFRNRNIGHHFIWGWLCLNVEILWVTNWI